MPPQQSCEEISSIIGKPYKKHATWKTREFSGGDEKMDRERLQIVKPQGAVAAIDEQKNLVVLVERKRNGVNGRFEKRGEIRDQNSDAVGKIDFPQAVSECNGALMPVVRQVRR